MTNGRDISEALAAALSVIPDVRVHAFAPDTFLPPGIVVQQPVMTWETQNRSWCTIQWEFPIAIAVSRNQDRAAQHALFNLVEAVGDVLAENSTLDDIVNHTQVISANPGSITSGGIEYPVYILTARVIA